MAKERKVVYFEKSGITLVQDENDPTKFMTYGPDDKPFDWMTHLENASTIENKKNSKKGI